SCLMKVFGSENVYRIGGDEFAIYSFDESREAFEGKITAFRDMVRGKGHYVSVGFTYADNGDPDYNSRRIEADNRMYDDKREFYRDKRDRRKQEG
ncbi:MAG: hypothetical protein K6E33_03320, partial [Lachnospiraceae bacterium]|nr:hypothetical protein [Lachnospiraceae bacterium]